MHFLSNPIYTLIQQCPCHLLLFSYKLCILHKSIAASPKNSFRQNTFKIKSEIHFQFQLLPTTSTTTIALETHSIALEQSLQWLLFNQRDTQRPKVHSWVYTRSFWCWLEDCFPCRCVDFYLFVYFGFSLVKVFGSWIEIVRDKAEVVISGNWDMRCSDWRDWDSIMIIHSAISMWLLLLLMSFAFGLVLISSWFCLFSFFSSIGSLFFFSRECETQ